MVAHKCLRETEINTLTISNKYMSEKIDKIENKVDEIKDFIWTMQLSYTKDNSEIKQLLQEGFKKSNEDIKKWANEKFASKLSEVIIYSFVWIILTIVAGSLVYTVIIK